MALHPTVVVVGATGAIGSASAALLARRGAQVTVMARPTERLEALFRRLGGEEQRVTSVPVDLTSSASVRAAARQLNSATGHIDALINAAAAFSPTYRKTPDGIESMLATNLLGPFLLTNLLRDRLAGGGRVLTLAAPSTTRVDMTQLTNRQAFRSLRVFGATKAADLMFSFELARRGKRWDVRANAFHPGLVRSELMGLSPSVMRLLVRVVSGSPDQPAQDLAELALSPAYAGTSGWFFKGTRRIDPPRHTADPNAQNELWRRCAELAGLEEISF